MSGLKMYLSSTDLLKKILEKNLSNTIRASRSLDPVRSKLFVLVIRLFLSTEITCFLTDGFKKSHNFTTKKFALSAPIFLFV